MAVFYQESEDLEARCDLAPLIRVAPTRPELTAPRTTSRAASCSQIWIWTMRARGLLLDRLRLASVLSPETARR